MTLLANKFVQIASKIDATNAQMAALQAKLSELQDYQQQLLDPYRTLPSLAVSSGLARQNFSINS